ncbi:hypothetical protein HOH87_06710 [bacterium]|jgi:flagellar protein FliJ|nr:hypothetical protein [bacterium]
MAKTPKKSKRFLYNLKSVLKYREIRETQEQDKFNAAERKFIEEKKKEDELKNQQSSEYTELRGRMSEGATIDFQQVQMRRAHLDILKDKVVEQEKVRVDAETAKEDQREELVKAVKDKKILEKDKEKKRESWKEVMKKEDVKFMDEISSIGFLRKRREKDGS